MEGYVLYTPQPFDDLKEAEKMKEELYKLGYHFVVSWYVKKESS